VATATGDGLNDGVGLSCQRKGLVGSTPATRREDWALTATAIVEVAMSMGARARDENPKEWNGVDGGGRISASL
jgi:hypothetical protein